MAEQQTKTQGEVEKIVEKGEKKLEKVAEELQVILPKTKESLGIRIIALLSLVGGLSLIAGIITDIFSYKTSFALYVVRFVSGLIFLAIAYGLIKKKRWPIWIMALVVIIGAFTNPAPTIVLLLLFIYLWTRKKELPAGRVDLWFEDQLVNFKKWFNSKTE